MDKLGKKNGSKIEEACPVCGMLRTEWPDGGLNVNGTSYCCRGCAEGTGCTCGNFDITPKPINKP
jgi:hypothetical protein